MPLYLLNLAPPVTLSYLNAYILLELGVNANFKRYLFIIFVYLGFIVSLVSNLTMGPLETLVLLGTSKWQNLSPPLQNFSSCLRSNVFYVGFTFMLGAYKITRSKLLFKKDAFKNIIYLMHLAWANSFYFLKKLLQSKRLA